MDEKVQAHAQLALIPDIWPLSPLTARTEKKKVFCHDLPPARGLWWAGPCVEGYEMRVVEEQRTLAFWRRMGLVSLKKQKLKILKVSLSQVKLAAMTRKVSGGHLSN